jgi:hypothetical protein
LNTAYILAFKGSEVIGEIDSHTETHADAHTIINARIDVYVYVYVYNALQFAHASLLVVVPAVLDCDGCGERLFLPLSLFLNTEVTIFLIEKRDRALPPESGRSPTVS